jgi:ADP-ribose pyrophosphatase YjhB (NUDIX family)
MALDTPPDYFKNPPPRRLGVLALLARGTEFAVIRRSYWSPIAMWGLPGGSVAPNERPWTALTRLIEEKLTLRATPDTFLGIDHAPAKPGHYAEGINILYRVQVPDRAELLAVTGSGYAEVRWVTAESVRELAVDHELLRIEQCLEAVRTGTVRELLLGVAQHQRPGA